MPHVGLHVAKGKAKTLYSALLKDIKHYNINAAQIFVANPRSGKPMNFEKNGAQNIKKLMRKDDIKLYVHTAYITTMIWSDKPYGIKLLKDQMKLALECGAEGVVLHLPKKSCKTIVDTLTKYKNYINSIKIKLLLEPPAFKADAACSFETPFKLNRLTDLIEPIGLKRWGYTIDTAHLWSSITEKDRKKGLKIETCKGANIWIKGLSKKTKKRIKLIHLNGSHSLTGKDKHAIPVYGMDGKIPDYMWQRVKKNKSKLKKTSLYRFVKFARAKKIPMILEVNAGTGKQIKDSLKLIGDVLSQTAKHLLRKDTQKTRVEHHSLEPTEPTEP